MPECSHFYGDGREGEFSRALVINQQIFAIRMAACAMFPATAEFAESARHEQAGVGVRGWFFESGFQQGIESLIELIAFSGVQIGISDCEGLHPVSPACCCDVEW